MTTPHGRRFALALGTCLALTSVAPPVGGRAKDEMSTMSPSIVMFRAGSLPKPLFLTSMPDIATFLQSVEPLKGDSDEGPRQNEPFLEVSLFWGAQWTRYVRDGEPLEALRPEQAGHHGRLYARGAEKSPLFLQTSPILREGAQQPVPTSLSEFTDMGRVTGRGTALLKRVGLLR